VTKNDTPHGLESTS